MRRFKLVLLVVAMIVNLALVAVACGGGDEEPAEETGEPIVIGVASAQTGFFSFYDNPIATAIKMAAEEFNAEGGIDGRTIEVVVVDTKSDTNLSAQAATEALEKGADFVVTMCDFDLGAPAARVAGEQGTVAFTCAGSPLFGPAGIGPLAFSVSEGTPTQGAVGAEFALEQEWRTAYLLTDVATEYSKTWCENLEERFKEGGGQIVGRDTFQLGDETVAPQVSRMRGASFDFVALCGFPPIGATAVRQIRAAGIDAPIIGTAGFDGPFWIGAVPNVSNVYVPTTASLFGDDPNSKVNELVQQFAEQTGKRPDTAYFLYGFAIVEAIKLAVEEAGTVEGEAVGQALEGFDALDLVIGPTSYTEKCHVSLGRPMRIVQYQNGEGSFLQELDPEKVPMPRECA